MNYLMNEKKRESRKKRCISKLNKISSFCAQNPFNGQNGAVFENEIELLLIKIGTVSTVQSFAFNSLECYRVIIRIDLCEAGLSKSFLH
jgi:hypothetical protein